MCTGVFSQFRGWEGNEGVGRGVPLKPSWKSLSCPLLASGGVGSSWHCSAANPVSACLHRIGLPLCSNCSQRAAQYDFILTRSSRLTLFPKQVTRGCVLIWFSAKGKLDKPANPTKCRPTARCMY